MDVRLFVICVWSAKENEGVAGWWDDCSECSVRVRGGEWFEDDRDGALVIER